MNSAILIVFYLFIKYSSAIETCDVTWDITSGLTQGTDIVFNDKTFTENDYFSNSSGVFGCVCNVVNCVQDCCPSGQVLDASSDEINCITPQLASYTNLRGVKIHNIIHVPDREICTEEKVKIKLNASEYDVELLNGGVLQWENLVVNYTEYCISSVDGHVVLIICVTDDNDELSGTLYSIGMIISMPFLLITFIVYLLLPDRNLHQKALMLYVLSLLISYILLVTVNLYKDLYGLVCESVGYMTVFFFMVSFFWMNVICFDIWYTFSGGRGFIGSKRTSEKKRFLFYCCYAFGVPICMAIITYLMSIKLPEKSPHNPNIGRNKCFLADGWPHLWYFHLEAGTLVVANMIFFILTALKIRQVKRETSMLQHSDSKRHNYEKDKQSFNLYVKLLFIMGVNWSTEVISWLVNWKTGNKIQYIWYATDFVNAVYGLLIFFIFVFKKKTWTLLQRRYYNFIGRPHLAQTVTSTTNTRSSHYYSTSNYSTAETAIPERNHATNGHPAQHPEEIALKATN